VDFALGTLEHEGFALRGRFSAECREPNGASAGCWRGFIATHSTGCAERSSQSPRRTSCDSCSGGSASRRDREPRARRLGGGARRPRRLRARGGRLGIEVLPARLMDYDPLWLDGLCLSGEIAWGRLTATRNTESECGIERPVPSAARPLRCSGASAARSGVRQPRNRSRDVALLRPRRRCSLHSSNAARSLGIRQPTGYAHRSREGTRRAGGVGLVSSDSFAGCARCWYRRIGAGHGRRLPAARQNRAVRRRDGGTLVAHARASTDRRGRHCGSDRVATVAPIRRGFPPPGAARDAPGTWRDILRVYRRLEARGEIRAADSWAGSRVSSTRFQKRSAAPHDAPRRWGGGTGRDQWRRSAEPRWDPDARRGGAGDYQQPRSLSRRGAIVVKESEGKERFLVEVPTEERDVLRAALMRRRPVPLVRTYLGKSRAG